MFSNLDPLLLTKSEGEDLVFVPLLAPRNCSRFLEKMKVNYISTSIFSHFWIDLDFLAVPRQLNMYECVRPSVQDIVEIELNG